MGDQDATSTSTTTPKNDLQKLLSPHYDDTQVSGHLSRTPTIALEALPRLGTFGRGSMTTINTYNSTKGHPTEARQSSSGTTLRFKPNGVQASGSRSTSLSPSTRGQGNQYNIRISTTTRRAEDTSQHQLRLKSSHPRKSSKALANHSSHTGHLRQV